MFLLFLVGLKNARFGETEKHHEAGKISELRIELKLERCGYRQIVRSSLTRLLHLYSLL